jgi:uncharacterized protein (TIGR03083 family)
MDPAEIVAAVAIERVELAGELDDLTAAEWSTPSLCPGWTVQDVVAHLTLATRLSRLAAIGGVLKARGDIDRMIGDAARDRAARFAPAELVAQLRETAGSAKRPLGTQPPDPLVDVLVHGQDIVRPLGRIRAMAPDRVSAALAHVAGSSFYGVRKRFAGLRFVATDLDWSTGSGAEVRGPGGQLLVLLTGRPSGLDGLEGPGAATVGARLA